MTGLSPQPEGPGIQSIANVKKGCNLMRLEPEKEHEKLLDSINKLCENARKSFKRMKTVQIKANLTWLVFQDRKSKYWIGVCQALHISSQGKSIADLHENINDAINTLLHDLAESQELDSFLQQHGWTLVDSLPEKPSNARFEIPYNIEQRSQHDLEAVLG
ncbi:MAG: hypothetical protein ABSG59_20705 [Verrucomicrobiota bacterium]